jgi:hypothetical protein
MNALKLALLGTAALAAVSVSARADDLSDLKAQIEALNGRISQLEATPAIPAGYQLLTVSETNSVIVPDSANAKFFGTKGTAIGIMPTADVPASTNIVWTGFVSAALTYKNAGAYDYNNDGDKVDTYTTYNGFDYEHALKALDVKAKAGLNVTGTTDTAVGEVGVSITLLAEVAATGGVNRAHDGAVATDGFKGWWKITPELELSGGVFGTAAGNGQGWDGKCKCYYAAGDGSGGYGTSGGNDTAQIRLTYASGPISFAMAVEDYDHAIVAGVSTKSALGFAGEMKYSGDSYGFELNGGYWNSARTAVDSNWTINAGANIGLGDMATLSMAVGVGEDRHLVGNQDRYTKGSLFVSFDLSDAVTAQLGVSHRNYGGPTSVFAQNFDSTSFGGGIYYTPVSQLTLGLEADYTDRKKSYDTLNAALVTIYRF